MTRVMIVDDHGLVRAGLTELLETFPEVDIIAAASGGEEAIELAVELSPEVVLMDLEMPGVDGIAATREILRRCTGTHVVILTSFSDKERILQALDAGAVGYLLKDAEPAELARGIAAAARGDSPLDPRAARTVLTARVGPSPNELLSEREREVLVQIARGLSNKEIASQLSISEKTVKAHLTSIFRQINVSDRAQAALWARSRGLTQADGDPAGPGPS